VAPIAFKKLSLLVVGGLILGTLYRSPLGQKWCEHFASRWIESYERGNDSVLATVLEFDKRDARVTVRFDKLSEFEVVIIHAYPRVAPPEGATLAPLPEPLREKANVFDKMALMFPPDCGFAVADGKHELITFLLAPESNLVLNAGSTNMNLYPAAGSLDELCEQFVDDTPFDFGIHFDLVDAEGQLHEVDLPLGTYSRNDRKRLLVGDSLPLSVELLPSPTVTAKDAEEFLIDVTEQRTPLSSSHDKTGKPYRRQFYRNLSPHNMIVIVSDPPEEHVPLVMVEEKVGIAVNVAFETEAGDSVLGGSRMFENVVSADGGKTSTSLGTLVSNAWSSAATPKETGRVLPLELPASNYSLLVGEDKWAQALFNVRYSLNRSGCVKLFPPDELSISVILSNRLVLAKASHPVDTGWTHIPDVDAFIGSNKGLLLVVKSELVLDPNSPHAFKGGVLKFTSRE
jgi:hypothetical protein